MLEAAMSQSDSIQVACEVLEVLPGYGLAHLKAPDGSIYSLNRQTLGIQLENLQPGQRVLVDVTLKFSRVL